MSDSEPSEAGEIDPDEIENKSIFGTVMDSLLQIKIYTDWVSIHNW